MGSDCRYGGGATNKGEKDGFYFLETVGFNSVIRKLDEKGEVKTVSPDVHGSVDCFQKVGDTFYYVGMRCNGLQEIYCCKEGGEENCLTCFNKEFLQSHSVVEPKYMHFTDKDGVGHRRLDSGAGGLRSFQEVSCDPQCARRTQGGLRRDLLP